MCACICVCVYAPELPGVFIKQEWLSIAKVQSPHLQTVPHMWHEAGDQTQLNNRSYWNDFLMAAADPPSFLNLETAVLPFHASFQTLPFPTHPAVVARELSCLSHHSCSPFLVAQPSSSPHSVCFHHQFVFVAYQLSCANHCFSMPARLSLNDQLPASKPSWCCGLDNSLFFSRIW